MVFSMKYMIIFSLIYLTIDVHSIPLPSPVTSAPKLQGKMLAAGGMMPYPTYPTYQQFPTVGGFPGAQPPMYGPQRGQQFGDMHPYGGNGYIPNYLQQYDMLYSRNRKTFM